MSTEVAERDESIVDAEFTVTTPTALQAITKGEIDIQIATAKRWPRSLKRFKEEAETIACNDIETAESCWYSVPRDGKNIDGPSIRLAEICASAWGNMRIGARVIDIGDKAITAQGFCHDLEKNVAISIEADIGILKRNGQRYSDTMVLTAGRSAMSIALRNAIFRVIPRALVNQILAKARDTAKGSIKSLEASRVAIADYFEKKGINKKRIAAAVGKSAIDDLTVDDILTLRGMTRAINDGQMKLEEAFPAEETKEGKESLDSLDKKLQTAGTNGHDTKKEESGQDKAATEDKKSKGKRDSSLPGMGNVGGAEK